MSVSKNSKDLHSRQSVAAAENFKEYKKYICAEFVSKFGGSYATPDKYKDAWRHLITWAPEREIFLIEKTKLWIVINSKSHSEIYSSPRYFKHLINKICEYLSNYTCRREEKPDCSKAELRTNRNNYTQKLYDVLYTRNRAVQNEIKWYCQSHQNTWIDMQKENAKNERQKAAQQRRKRIKQGTKQFLETGILPTDVNILHTSRQVYDLRIYLMREENKEQKR